MSFFIAGLFSSIGHIGEPAKYIDLSINSHNSGFLDCHEISEVLNLEYMVLPFYSFIGTLPRRQCTLDLSVIGSKKKMISTEHKFITSWY